MTILLNSGYIVKKDSISEKQIKQIRNELNVYPMVFGGPKQNFIRDSDKFKVYRESESRFRLPRFYGIEWFGSPSTNKLKNGTKINVEFQGSLKKQLNQDIACEKTLHELNSNGGCILSLPTGYGKTTCALYVLSKLSVKTLIIVHKEILLNQWTERINQFMPNASIGIIRQNKIDITGKDIVIGMLQSLSMKEYSSYIFSEFGLTIIDETHHICSKVFSNALFLNSTKYILGLSATPERKDGLTKVLHWFLGPISYMIKRENQEGVDIKIVNFNCESYNNPPPLNTNGLISLPGVISQVVKIEERNDVIIKIIEDCVKDSRKIIVLSERREHCEYMCERVKQLFKDITEYSFGLYMGGMKQTILKQNEECNVIFATYSLAHEGLDIPSLNTLIMATPKSDVVQSCGRILREAGMRSKSPLIYDIVDKYASLLGQSKKRLSFYKSCGFKIST
jgi:superfamily II DNA or RNA helicase